MAFALAPTAQAAGYRLESFDTIGSTNAVALERARAGDAGRLWLASAKQESGRGRRGRSWQTAEGNLAATLLLVPDCALSKAATLGFVAGLALADALEAVAPLDRLAIGVDGATGLAGGRFELKWPNDVLAGGAKLSGILLESTMLGAGRFAVAIGIGVNVIAHPDDTPYRSTSLKALGSVCDAAQLFLALSDAWVDNERIWADGNGIADIRRRWLNRAAGIGGEVAVTIGGDVARGRFETIDDEGRFVIRRDDGSSVVIAAGDVHFGGVASAPAG